MYTAINKSTRCTMVLAGVLTCSNAGAAEVEATLGTLLLDPFFEDVYLQTLQNAIWAERESADGENGEADVSIGALRLDPDFESALTMRLQEIAVSRELDRGAVFGGVLYQSGHSLPSGGDGLAEASDNGGEFAIHTYRPEIPATTPTRPPVGVFTLRRCGVENRVNETLDNNANGTGWDLAAAKRNAQSNAFRDAVEAQSRWVSHQVCPSNCPLKWTSTPIPTVPPATQDWFDIALTKASSTTTYASTAWTAEVGVLCTGIMD